MLDALHVGVVGVVPIFLSTLSTVSVADSDRTGE